MVAYSANDDVVRFPDFEPHTPHMTANNNFA